MSEPPGYEALLINRHLQTLLLSARRNTPTLPASIMNVACGATKALSVTTKVPPFLVHNRVLYVRARLQWESFLTHDWVVHFSQNLASPPVTNFTPQKGVNPQRTGAAGTTMRPSAPSRVSHESIMAVDWNRYRLTLATERLEHCDCLVHSRQLARSPAHSLVYACDYLRRQSHPLRPPFQ